MPLIATKTLSATERRQVSRRAAAGHLRPLYAGVYTDDLVTPVDVLIRRELFGLCAILAPDAVISHRSALESTFSPGGDYFLTGPYRRVIDIGNFRLKIFDGPAALPSDIRIPTAHGPIHRSGEARAILENFQRARTPADGDSRVLDRADLEDRIERRLTTLGEDSLNRLRDEARQIAEPLGLTAEFNQLDRVVGTLLRTRSHNVTGPRAVARAAGRPYDGPRVDLFDQLLSECNRNPIPVPIRDPELDPKLVAFVESYFSNYIEGTEFELEEACEIVLTGRPMMYREDDSHDIIGTYDAILASMNAPTFPQTYPEFEDQLKTWNRKVISTRGSKKPGEFKEKPNRAGNTFFVDPELTPGTLEKGYERIMAVAPGAARAAMAMFVVSEVHPFADGNGRTARLAMNMALSAESLTRIIVPTVFRDDYILALKALTNSGNATPYMRMLTRAASFSRWLDLRSQPKCFEQLHSSNSLLGPAEGKLVFDSSQTTKPDLRDGDPEMGEIPQL